jgi:hypothetical protein
MRFRMPHILNSKIFNSSLIRTCNTEKKRIKPECRKFSYLGMNSHMHEDRPAAGKGCPAFPTLERGAAALCHPLYEIIHVLLFSRHFPAFPGPPAPPLYGR